MITDPGRVPLGRRAWVGDGRHGASIAPDGTIDWYAPDGLTSEPALWRLLDDAGPAVRVGPVRGGSSARRQLPATTMRYRPGTCVVETVMEGAAGRRVEVIDFVPWEGTGSVLRLVRALSGPVEVEVEVWAGPPRSPGGSTRRVVPTGEGLLLDGVTIAAPAPFDAAPLDRDTPRWRAVLTLDTGEAAVVSIGAGGPIGPDRAYRMLEDTELSWRSWLAPSTFGGSYRTALERALLSIRALTGPGGGAAGAGTTSLPRRVGSERSADDRWVRVRDVARSVRLLAAAGLDEEAERAETWLRQTVSTAHLPWPAWLDTDGQPVPEAEEVRMEGWRRSQPVLAGRRGALDVGVVGEVSAAARDHGALSAVFDALAEATDWAADHWREPDAGRWEIERPHRLYTAGRVEVWSALDRMARRARAANPLDLRAAAWQQEGRDLLSWLESEAVAPDGGLRMDAAPGSADEADAALLSTAWQGPWPTWHPLVAATVDRVLERLTSGLLLYRYTDRVADERAGPDLPDVEASLLGVRALAGLGRWDEAHERMDAVVGLVERAGPGLLAETADPVSGELFGNFPSTAAAMAMVEAGLVLETGPR